MKKVMLGSLLFFVVVSSEAQTRKASKTGNPKMTSKSVTKPQTLSTLQSTSSNQAKAPVSTTQNFSIADPTIRALNDRANGGDVRISNSGIVGMPKRAYGFANGHLTLYTTSATSSGTITGSGSVGTGSSLGSIGTNGPGMGVNGKSPYAGSTMWGNARGMILTKGDSSVRTTRN